MKIVVIKDCDVFAYFIAEVRLGIGHCCFRLNRLEKARYESAHQLTVFLHLIIVLVTFLRPEFPIIRPTSIAFQIVSQAST